jgi:MFS family permease
MHPNEKNILTVTCFGHFMSHFNMLMFPAIVLPLSDILSLELGRVLSLSFWMYLLFGLTALPWGLLSDRFGARPLLLLFYAGAGLSGICAALFMTSPLGFSLSLAGIGFFSGIYHPAGLGLITRGVSRMSLALGYNGMAGNAGLAAAPLITGLINYVSGPQAAFLFLAGCNGLGALLMLLLPSSEPQRSPKGSSSGSGDLIIAFGVLCICMMLGGVAYRGASVILPAFFELRLEALNDFLSRLEGLLASRNVAATALTSFVFFVGILGQYIGGRAADRFDPRRGYLLFHALTVPLGLSLAFFTDIPLLLAAMAYLLFLLGMQPIENTLVAKISPDRLRHSAYGIKFILTFGVGSLAVFLAGWIEQAWSLPAVFIAMSGVSLALVLMILVLMALTRRLRI